MEVNRLAYLTAMGSLRPPSPNGDWSKPQDAPHKSVIDMMASGVSHIKVLKVDIDAQHLCVCLPHNMLTCCHPAVDMENLLGSGSFGKVYASGPGICAKVFTSAEAFYHETVMMDLVALARSYNCDDFKSVCLQFYLSACITCKTIWYPRFSQSLHTFKDFTVDHLHDLDREFKGLTDAVFFLNQKCGLFHGDICPSNILVETFKGPGSGIKSLILTDLGTAAIHAGNTFKSLSINNPQDDSVIYNAQIYLSPFLVCKDYVKPLCVLRRCYLLRHHAQDVDVEEITDTVVGQNMALKIDCSTLLQVLLLVLARVMEQPNSLTYESWLREIEDDSSDAYFLLLLGPKLVLLTHLSQLWEINFDVGVNTQGVLSRGQLPHPHTRLLKECCQLFREEFDAVVKEEVLIKLGQGVLKNIIFELLQFDYFEIHGRQPQHGLFAQSHAARADSEHGNWRTS
ncbi:ORF36 [Alcelaphine gammaherpesvirus 1]|nr:ORF36 [Alcelaphine gammaherpesvirus 1]QDY92269.1 tegument serine/threonine protein kinase [Alcelaphine gammaherpesvirus 1]